MRILIVEDEADIRDLMLLHLKRAGFDASATDNGEEGLARLERDRYDLAILDWMLPGLSGLEMCKRLARKIPVLMVTARADAADVVRGLEAGADDYVTKPFEIPVFLARVNALLRRLPGDQAPSRRLSIGKLTLDLDSHDVTSGREPLALTTSEFKLLKALMLNRGKVLSRDRLIELVQGEGVVVVDRAIDTHVFGLRKKLGDAAELVETIRGVGYRVKAEL